MAPAMSNDLDFDGTQKAIYQALVGSTRAAALISAQDTTFYRSLDPSLGRSLDRQGLRLLQLTQRLLRRCLSSTEQGSPTLQNHESVETNWTALVDVIDNLLERTDNCLDEFNGIIKRGSSKDHAPLENRNSPAGRKRNQLQSRTLSKPQKAFTVNRSNNETEPFIPSLNAKPHALITLGESRILDVNDYGQSQYTHPYKPEIESYTYPTFVYATDKPQAYTAFDNTTAEFVDTLDGVYDMLSELKNSTVIAVDLEHHDAHSYVGIVSLMQISTRDRDWLVDTLKPWRHKLEVLNEVFADPKILKVLHGAHMDVIWLQRDFGIYVVGLFDTHHASRVLGYPGGSLAFLLKKFVNFDAQKQHQTADWRLRPLPTELFDYARADTHFLLYIYDNMRNELLARSKINAKEDSLMKEVLQRSKDTSLQRYEHFFYDEDRGLGRGGWFSLLQRTPALLSKEQFAVFRKVHQWRDQVARLEDENPTQIVPNHTLFSVSQALPRELSALLSVLHPISYHARSRVNDLLNLINTAMAAAANEPDVQEMFSRIAKNVGVERRPFPSNVRRAGVHVASNAEENNRTGPTSANVRADVSDFWGLCPLGHQQTTTNVNSTYEVLPQASVLDSAKSPSSIRKEHNSLPAIALGKRKAETVVKGSSAALLETGPAGGTQVPLSGHHELDRVHEKIRRRAGRIGNTKTPSAVPDVSETSQGAFSDSVNGQEHFDYEAATSVLNVGKRRAVERERISESRASDSRSWLE